VIDFLLQKVKGQGRMVNMDVNRERNDV